MAQVYSDTSRENDKWSLPDAETFQLTAAELAESADFADEQYGYLKRFPLAAMNSKVREKMLDTMIDELCIEGGWFYHYCLPGCLPDSSPIGPFDTEQAAIEALRNE